MIKSTELSSYLHEFLNCEAYQDYAPNGLQVEGKTTIKRIATAVTASEEAISQAIAKKADALLVHHGYFWKGEDPRVCGVKRQRLAQLLKHDLNLLAYHLPLDCHTELGNNACLAKLLLVDEVQRHQVDRTKNLLWSGTLATPMSASELGQFLKRKLGREPLHLGGNNRQIKTLAWCSGAAQDLLETASQLGVDAYLSGEVSERTYYQAKELGIHYYSCGHHATERFGIQSLGAHLEQHFGLEHWFIDSENPI